MRRFTDGSPDRGGCGHRAVPRHRWRRLALIAAILLSRPAWAQDERAVRLFEAAERLEQDAQTPLAYDQYELLVGRYPDDLLAPVALLRMGQRLWETGDVAGARAVVDQLNSDYPQAPSAAGGVVLVGMMQRAEASDPAGLRQALAIFDRVSQLYALDGYPDPQWRRDALMQIGDVRVLLGELDLAAAAYLAAVEDEAFSTGVARAQLKLSEVFGYQGNWAAAAEVLQRVVESGLRESALPLEVETARRARERLSLIHRLVLRPTTGSPAWRSNTSFGTGGRVQEPIGLAVGPAGRLLIADERSDQSWVFDAGRQLIAGPRSIAEIRLPWWGASGQPFILSKTAVRSAMRDDPPIRFQVPDGDDLETLSEMAAGTQGALGQWLVLDTDPRQVLMFDASQKFEKVLVRGEVIDVASDDRGQVYVLD